MIAMLMAEQQPQEVERPMPKELPNKPQAQDVPPAAKVENQNTATVQPAQFMPLRPSPEAGSQKMDLIMDVPFR